MSKGKRLIFTLYILLIIIIIFFININKSYTYNIVINNYNEITKIKEFIKYKNNKITEEDLNIIYDNLNNYEYNIILLAILGVETNYTHNKTSSIGAIGIGQIYPKVWKEQDLHNLDTNLKVAKKVININAEYCTENRVKYFGYSSKADCIIRKYFGVSKIPFTSANNFYAKKANKIIAEYTLFKEEQLN